MKNKILLTLFLVLMLNSFSLLSQTLSANYFIRHISFEFKHSLRIPDNYIRIDINKTNDNSVTIHVISKPMTDSDKWAKTQIDTSYQLDTVKFNKILFAVFKITKIDIGKAITIGNDGNNCKIAFGVAENDISYEFWSPDYDTKNRNLTDFMTACNLIIEAANLKPKNIF